MTEAERTNAELQHQRELLVHVRCVDASDQRQLAERFRLEGRAVTLTTMPRDSHAGVNAESK